MRQIKQRKKRTIIQRINCGSGKFKFIRHTLMGFIQGLPTKPSEPSDKTLKRKRERDRSVLVWDSQRKGTYVRAKHGRLF